jgi:hypothetical protein
MGTETAPAPIPPLQKPGEITSPGTNHQSRRIRILVENCRKALEVLRKLAFAVWRTLPSYLAFYLLALVTAFAAWHARNDVTVIAPFQMPDKVGLPFGGDTVANVLQDRLAQIHEEIERQRNDNKLHATDMHSLGQPGLQIPPGEAEFRRAEVPTRFAVEVKGLSYQGLISVARAVMGTETTISGDLILDDNDGKNFILIARAATAALGSRSPAPLPPKA